MSSLSLSWLLVAGDSAFHLLVTVLTSTHLLLASAAASPGALGVLPYFLYGCAHTCGWARGFLMLPACPSPSFGLLVYWFLRLLFSTRVPYLRVGSPLRGRGLFVLDRNDGLVSPSGPGTLDSSWLDLPPLSAGICAPCSSGCVARWSSLCP